MENSFLGLLFFLGLALDARLLIYKDNGQPKVLQIQYFLEFLSSAQHPAVFEWHMGCM